MKTTSPKNVDKEINKKNEQLIAANKVVVDKRNELLEAVKKIKDEKVKLIVFGSVTPELKDKVIALSDGEKRRGNLLRYITPCRTSVLSAAESIYEHGGCKYI